MDKAEQILEKHINENDLNFIFHENKDLWQELLNAVNEALGLDAVMQNKVAKYFKLYNKVKAELDHYVSMRGSRFGIAAAKDEYAIKWRGKRMRLEILEAFLEGRSPNWYLAYYLNNEEMDRRNQSYCAQRIV
jgi:hypothetical protein